MNPDPHDVEALRREKYKGDPNADMREDLERLAEGEPLAYVIGTIPFLGLTVQLDSHPLIPRPETEWWTEKLIARIGEASFNVLDLCAGSGAIGLSILKHCPHAHVSFGELIPEHADLIRKNIEVNKLDTSRADVRAGDLFTPFASERFDIIATNPPYIPQSRELSESVTKYEPKEALFGGEDGLEVISRIVGEVRNYLKPGGELWMECDIENVDRAQERAFRAGAERTEIHTDQYGRPRLLVTYYSHESSESS